MDIQVHVPAALCALHNFMHSQEPDTYFLEIDDAKEDWKDRKSTRLTPVT